MSTCDTTSIYTFVWITLTSQTFVAIQAIQALSKILLVCDIICNNWTKQIVLSILFHQIRQIITIAPLNIPISVGHANFHLIPNLYIRINVVALLFSRKSMWMSITLTLFRSITMFCGTDNIMWNIPHIQPKWWNILPNIVSPTWHCYGSKHLLWTFLFYGFFYSNLKFLFYITCQSEVSRKTKGNT